jgi:hypothetical protein
LKVDATKILGCKSVKRSNAEVKKEVRQSCLSIAQTQAWKLDLQLGAGQAV